MTEHLYRTEQGRQMRDAALRYLASSTLDAATLNAASLFAEQRRLSGEAEAMEAERGLGWAVTAAAEVGIALQGVSGSYMSLLRRLEHGEGRRHEGIGAAHLVEAAVQAAQATIRDLNGRRAASVPDHD